MCDIGIIGMAVMGQNLALNIARKGFRVAVFNRTQERTREFVNTRLQGEPIVPTHSLEEFVSVLGKPRRIMLMVKAGQAVDEFMEALFPLLEPGDLIIDGGNSFFQDTERRLQEAEKRGLLFLGTGVSGGEYGALHGPSIMPGGHREGYELVSEILERAAAQVEDGPCCSYLGPGGSGHFVKMVHNGIEYAMMEAIAEIYDILRKIYGLSSSAIQSIFEEWNESDVASYLVEITGKILGVEDPETKKPLVDLILDAAEQKGTGKWTSQVAFDLGVPTPVINQAVIARSLSSFKEKRVLLSQIWGRKNDTALCFDSKAKDALRQTLFLSMVAAFSEGFHLLQVASEELQYNLNLVDIARIWKGGCILRARMLSSIQKALAENPLLIFAASEFTQKVKESTKYARQIVKTALEFATPVPVLSATLAYIDSWTSASLPANLLQAQRDFFGAHTYKRIDRPGTFHTVWEGETE
ncbi:MAG: NADP-dependent phosphogluconate dehydrogenase [Candidatus Atribacteria bacterium]|nr:NADP-dependent phosphogluconate dehydrogenase [Candidatus Atribacteria bacterium]